MTGAQIKQRVQGHVDRVLPGWDGRVRFVTAVGWQNSTSMRLSRAAAEGSGLIEAIRSDPQLRVTGLKFERGNVTGEAQAVINVEATGRGREAD